MSWNYRVMRRGTDYGIYEVYYNESGEPTSVSDESVVPTAESPDELRDRLNMVLEAFGQKELDFDAFRFREPRKRG
jgi:hypothetical protein